MYVVAGPPGSGKSTSFPVALSGFAFFNIDDRAAELNGHSYRDIPTDVRLRAQQECREFIEGSISAQRSFAVETTLRDGAANRQAAQARANGFTTWMVYVATGDAGENVRRIAARGKAGGHCAPPDVLRRGYEASLSHLPEALSSFDRVELYDNSRQVGMTSSTKPEFVACIVEGKAQFLKRSLPAWVRRALKAAGIKTRS